MSDDSLTHYGIKGMRWGRRSNDRAAGPSAPPKAKTVASPTRSFSSAPPSGSASAPASKSSAPSSAKAAPAAKAKPTRRVPSNPESKMTPEQRAHRKKMLIGGAAVIGILGAAAIYKGSPQAVAAMSKLSVASQAKVTSVLAHPKAVNLKLAGDRKVNAVKLNALFKKAEITESLSKSKAGLAATKKVSGVKANPRIARAGISQNLNELRRDTEQIKAMNDAEQFVESIVKKRSAQRFVSNARRAAASGSPTPWNVGQR